MAANQSRDDLDCDAPATNRGGAPVHSLGGDRVIGIDGQVHALTNSHGRCSVCLLDHHQADACFQLANATRATTALSFATNPGLPRQWLQLAPRIGKDPSDTSKTGPPPPTVVLAADNLASLLLQQATNRLHAALTLIREGACTVSTKLPTQRPTTKLLPPFITH